MATRATDPFIENSIRTWDSPAAKKAREDRASNAQFAYGARSLSVGEGGLVGLALAHIGTFFGRRR